MNSRLIWVSVFCACGIIIEVDLNSNVTKDIPPYPFDRENSSYPERRWNLTRGALKDPMKDNHLEDCTKPETVRLAPFFARGPLCELCSKIIAKKYPPEKNMFEIYACYTHAYLGFSETDYDTNTMIDVVMCNYNTPRNYVGRFCVTRAGEESAVYSLEHIGSKSHKYVFILDGYITYDKINSTVGDVLSDTTN